MTNNKIFYIVFSVEGRQCLNDCNKGFALDGATVEFVTDDQEEFQNFLQNNNIPYCHIQKWQNGKRIEQEGCYEVVRETLRGTLLCLDGREIHSE